MKNEKIRSENVSFRLDERAKRILTAIADERELNISILIRQAIKAFIKKEAKEYRSKEVK